MALTESNMMPLGTVAPDFELTDSVSGETKSIAQLRSPVATVVMFICNHCPYVKHIQTELVRIANDYTSKDISFIAINANDAEQYPDDSPANMKQEAERLGYPFPYLFDESQEIAKAYQAACTPDFFVFDKDLKCVYRGRMDGATPGNDTPVTGEALRTTLDAILNNQPISPDQTPSMGCNIKWK